jgi:23S rRNA pseudouridine1911/1915/1917 synthase
VQKTIDTPTLAKRLRAERPEWSWNDCRRAITAGRVLIDGKPAFDPAGRINSNQKLEIRASGSKDLAPTKKKLDLKVYYSDEHLIVVEKPSGIESVPFATKTLFESSAKRLNDLTVIDLARLFLEREERRKLPPLRVVHRLDKGTSGVMAFARTRLAERELANLFRSHDITRSYLAVCLGVPKSGVIQSTLVEDRGDGRRGSTDWSGHRNTPGKKAITHVNVLETRNLSPHRALTLVECRLETGRTHQIRIHLAEAGHPLAGEKVYLTPSREVDPVDDYSKSPRIALHAKELGFKHPVSQKYIEWSSSLPDDLKRWWENLN